MKFRAYLLSLHILLIHLLKSGRNFLNAQIEIVTGEHDVEQRWHRVSVFGERIQGGELFDVEAQRLRKAFDDEIQGIPPFASCSPDTFAKIWPKFSERSKIEIVTGEHDVERGGTG